MLFVRVLFQENDIPYYELEDAVVHNNDNAKSLEC